MSFDKEIPSKGDTVRVTNTENDEIVVEGTVLYVARSSLVADGAEEDDNSVYMEIRIEENNALLFKWGYWNGEQYSWAKKTNYGGPEVDVGENCFDYTKV